MGRCVVSMRRLTVFQICLTSDPMLTSSIPPVGSILQRPYPRSRKRAVRSILPLEEARVCALGLRLRTGSSIPPSCASSAPIGSRQARKPHQRPTTRTSMAQRRRSWPFLRISESDSFPEILKCCKRYWRRHGPDGENRGRIERAGALSEGE